MVFDQTAWAAKKKAAKTAGHVAGEALITRGEEVKCPYRKGSSLYCIFYSAVAAAAGWQRGANKEVLRGLRQVADNLWAAYKKKRGLTGRTGNDTRR